MRWGAVLFIMILSGSADPPSAARAQATLSGELAVIGGNMLVGGGVAGLVALVQGRSVPRAFGQGALGGGVVYAGKRLTSLHGVTGSGVAGRLVSVVGSSMVRNSAAGRDPFSFLVVPLGPVTYYRTPDADSAHAPFKLHLGRTLFMAALIANDAVDFDWRESALAGAPVFQTPGRVLGGEHGWGAGGIAFSGGIVISDLELMPPRDHATLLAHERVHVLQDDFADFTLAGPAEGWLLERVPGGSSVRRYVDVGIVYVAAALLFARLLPYEQRPWEVEAAYLQDGW